MTYSSGYRCLEFAGQSTCVEWADAYSANIVQTLFGAHPPATGILPTTIFRLHNVPEQQLFTIMQNQHLIYRGENIGTGAYALLEAVMTHLIADCNSGLLLHSALCSNAHSRGIILPGNSGVGKSMLAAWLTTQGLNYHSDELVFFSGTDNHTQGLARPLCMKDDWQSSLDVSIKQKPIVCNTNRTLLPPSELSPTKPITDATTHIIVFPQFIQGAHFSLSQLSLAKAALKLAEVIVNAQNLPQWGRALISKLVRQTPAYTLIYGHFDQLNPLLQKINEPINMA